MKKKKILIIAIGIIAIIILSVACILGFINKDNDNKKIDEGNKTPVIEKVLIKPTNGEVNLYFKTFETSLNKNEYFDFTKGIKDEYKIMISKLFELEYLKYDVINNETENVLKVTYSNSDELKEIIKEHIEVFEGENIIFNFYYDEDIKFNELNLEEVYNLINRENIRRNEFVQTAIKELGNTGEKYYTWYGFNYRVEWCAVFVSWLANQHGLLETEIPKFASVKYGAWFYQERGTWKDNTYTPQPGDIIIFNYDKTDPYDYEHVGIVEKVQDGRIYTIEGNANYKNDPINTAVVRRNYPLKYHKIVGFGVPNFK